MAHYDNALDSTNKWMKDNNLSYSSNIDPEEDEDAIPPFPDVPLYRELFDNENALEQMCRYFTMNFEPEEKHARKFQEIMLKYKTPPPREVFRGTKFEKDIFETLIKGEPFTIKQVRKMRSWTTDEFMAQKFALKTHDNMQNTIGLVLYKTAQTKDIIFDNDDGYNVDLFTELHEIAEDQEMGDLAYDLEQALMNLMVEQEVLLWVQDQDYTFGKDITQILFKPRTISEYHNQMVYHKLQDVFKKQFQEIVNDRGETVVAIGHTDDGSLYHDVIAGWRHT